ncbi:uncharacterized protein G2W53_033951 [Senna tora]|uniref:Treslin n=1 Tax=Senna tora TaxID=362788 RepID=A0A834W7F1_9FABA|nr:uncharacterized protein G2W53_033951 [Senna tora]
MLQLADRSIAYPRVVIEDVLVQVDKFIFPTDFIILDYEEDREVPIILGRPFLATGRTIIDVQKGELKMRVQEEEVTFNVFKAMKLPGEPEECFRVNAIESSINSAVREVMIKTHPVDPLEAAIMSMLEHDEDDICDYVKMLESSPSPLAPAPSPSPITSSPSTCLHFNASTATVPISKTLISLYISATIASRNSANLLSPSSSMDADPIDPITGYAQTRRVVLLIDLNPLLHLHNPSPYINSLLAFAKTLLSFPPLSSSLFSFKLFFSSLSPLLSSSKLHRFIPNPSLSLSFNHPTSTLESLHQTLNSLPQFHNPLDPPPPPPRASHLAASTQQLVHDYAWDPVISDPLPDTLVHCNSVVRSNLVVLCSPICKSLKCLSEFFGVDTVDESLENVDSFCEKLSGFFNSVSGAFDSRDIHLSWVDFRCESECSEHKIEDDEVRQIYRLFESGIKTLGWGLCRVDSIILGSALFPFGLIYPKIGISRSFLDRSYNSRKLQVQLCLQIFDVNKNPIEYNCCDLELIDLKYLSKHEDVLFNPEFLNSQTGGCDEKETFWKQFGHGISKFQIRKVYRWDAFAKLRDCISNSILVREGFGESKKNKKESSNEFFADRVLEILATEFGHFWQRKSVPTWQILLSFLYKEGCWALVSLSNDSGVSLMGVLRPFTVSSALLSVVGNSDMACDYGEANNSQLMKTMDAEICKPSKNFRKLNTFLGSQAKKNASVIEGHQKKEMVDLSAIKNFTWNTFCNAAYEHHLEIDLYEIYSAKKHNESKKFKFLKCWMKQMKRPGFSDQSSLEKSKLDPIVPEENNNRLIESPQAGENPISSSGSAEEIGMTEASRIQDEAVLEFRSETSEAFFNSLSNKIHQGIESEVVDIGTLAERLVNSSIYWLYQKFDKEANSENILPAKCHDAYRSLVAAELTKLLLREPKELAAKHKSRNPGPSTLTTKHIVREYELQILFRMEILKSEVGSRVEESSKQKFVKQVCLLLENIQCHMEGGFFGDWNLDNYVAKIIKSRFSHTLGDVVHKIYNKMDLLLFADEDEGSNQLPNSEDSNKSWMEKADKEEMDENDMSNEPVSEENDTGRLQRNNQEDHDKRLMEAKERRERSRRFMSFTSWMPDLQRVWAPKQKAMKLPKRKERRRASCDRVCETPLSGHKRSCPWENNNTDDDTNRANGSQICGSVSKALFQDD